MSRLTTAATRRTSKCRGRPSEARSGVRQAAARGEGTPVVAPGGSSWGLSPPMYRGGCHADCRIAGIGPDGDGAPPDAGYGRVADLERPAAAPKPIRGIAGFQTAWAAAAGVVGEGREAGSRRRPSGSIRGTSARLTRSIAITGRASSSSSGRPRAGARRG